MGPLIIGLLAGGALLAFSKFKGSGGMPKATPGPVPVPPVAGTAAVAVVGPSGATYAVRTFQTDATSKMVTAVLTTNPLAWVLYKQSMTTGQLSGLLRGSGATPTMLADFGLNNIK
jgi:hypothetical protein